MLDTKYDAKKVEEGKYDYWIENKFFECGDETKKPYTIVIPPPNVTGKLHLGHAMDNTLQDLISRYKRLRGYDVLWVPGMDHAGIATQAKVDARLKAQGVSRYDLGREKLQDYYDCKSAEVGEGYLSGGVHRRTAGSGRTCPSHSGVGFRCAEAAGKW